MKTKQDKSDVYGEMTAPSIIRIAEHMKKHKKKSFLDIGSGYGLIARGIDEYFRETGFPVKVTGIEKNLERFEICNKIDVTKKKFRDKYKIVHGDIFDHMNLVKEADYIFSNSLLFPQTFPEKMVRYINPGTIFVHNTAHSKIENKSKLILSSSWAEKNYFRVYVK